MFNVAITIFVLAIICLVMFAGQYIARSGWWVVEAIAGFIRHELLMRPKGRYYRMGCQL